MARLRTVPDAPRIGVRYLRQSMATEETISDVIQRTATDDYAARHNIIWVSIDDPEWPSLRDGEIWEQHTGRVWHKRKGVLKIMDLVERGQVNVVVLWKWNRLSRKRLHWAAAEELVHRAGGTIESATEPADTSTATGKFTRDMLVDLGELQSNLIGETWIETHAVRRARGLPATGGDRYGYRWIKHDGEERYEIDADLKEVIEWMYEQYINGAGAASIALKLNRRGIMNLRGHTWTGAMVFKYLDSGFAAGLLCRLHYRDGRTVLLPFRERTWTKGAHEPIITHDTWKRYVAARHQREKTPVNTNPAHALTGLAICGHPEHGGKRVTMTRRSGTSRARSQVQLVCGAWKRGQGARCVSVSESRLTKAVRSWLHDFISDVERASQATTDIHTKRLRSRTAAVVIEGEIADIERQLVQLTRERLRGIVPEATYIATRDELLAEQESAEARLHAARLDAGTEQKPPVELAVSLLADWDILSAARRRSMLGKLIRNITIHPPDKRYGPARIAITTTWSE